MLTSPVSLGKKLAVNGLAVGFLAAMAVALSSFSARGDDDDNAVSTNTAERPIEELFKTDVVYPERKGELEVELASIYQNHADAETLTIPLSLEYGLNDRWQVEAEWDSFIE